MRSVARHAIARVIGSLKQISPLGGSFAKRRFTPGRWSRYDIIMTDQNKPEQNDSAEIESAQNERTQSEPAQNKPAQNPPKEAIPVDGGEPALNPPKEAIPVGEGGPTLNPPTEATPAGEGEPTRGRRAAGALRPILHRARLYLRVWIPFLTNPHEQQRLVKFKARFERESLNWRAEFPERCWKCAATESLQRRTFKRSLRVYDAPLYILGGAIFALLFVGLLKLLFAPWTTALLMSMAAITGGGALMFVKSWVEEVRLTFWTCEDHAKELNCPDMVADDNELYVYAPSAELAQAARAELKAKRKTHRRPMGPAADGTPARPAGPAVPKGGYIPPRKPPTTQDLPPIKMASDEDLLAGGNVIKPEDEDRLTGDQGLHSGDKDILSNDEDQPTGNKDILSDDYDLSPDDKDNPI